MENKITTKDGLLWEDGKIIELPLADWIAQAKGFDNAERYVKHLEDVQKKKTTK